jgi:two-component system, chemotaxis family, sensor kinase Cph1
VSERPGDLLAPGTPIDLDNCAREPIHIPGSVQPRGALVVVTEPEFRIVQVTANVEPLLGRAVDDLLDHPLSDLVGADQFDAILRTTATFRDLRERNPLDIVLDVGGERRPFDAILHRQAGLILLEFEAAFGPRPFSFPNTYQAVRGAVGELNRAATLDELYRITAQSVRELTGFDRVMVYRYDHEYNGEVVAEAKRDDLNSFLGLHYPASDIPAQARALYEQNWIRLIDDVSYAPSPLIPTINPRTGAPLDLTHATLRSVSPIHIEYLHNMGVQASMSISLLRDDKLWGLIACHHYSGPHRPPYGTRAAAEFLGSTLSLRLVDRSEDYDLAARLAAQSVLAKITSATLDESGSLADALLGEPGLLELVPSDGVAINVRGRYDTRGVVPDEAVVRHLAGWARDTGEDVFGTDSLERSVPDTGTSPAVAAGTLAVTLPGGQFVIWFRAERLRSVDWGGDPTNKAIAVQEGDTVRLSPRKSFDRWREVIQGRSEPWTQAEQEDAESLRRLLVEAMYQRSRSELRVAEALQRSLLPEIIPDLPDWNLSADYEPAAGGRIGGDWYDAFMLRDGRLAVVLGDVAGHGTGAAGVMAQLRNALRAHLFGGSAPDVALRQTNEFCLHLSPGAFATVIAACIDLTDGSVQLASAGHPRPFLVDGTVEQLDLAVSPPLGVVGVEYRRNDFVLQPGHGLVLFSDGLIERRDESIGDGVARLARTLRDLGEDPDAHAIAQALSRPDRTDDVTVLTLRRPLG